jgi:hypothetical protein
MIASTWRSERSGRESRLGKDDRESDWAMEIGQSTNLVSGDSGKGDREGARRGEGGQKVGTHELERKIGLGLRIGIWGSYYIYHYPFYI